MKKAIVMQTDFGVDNLSVSTMFGICRIVDPELDVYNSTHAITQFDMPNASDALMYTIPFWPEDTVFVPVVDPGVGTKRHTCVARLKTGQYVVTPDNGTLTALRDQLAEIRRIDETVNRLPGSENGNTFHGRDVFVYCAARLASGVIDFEGVGPAYEVADVVTYAQNKPEIGLGIAKGEIEGAGTHFGGLSFNIPAKEFEKTGIRFGDMTHITIEKGGEIFFDDDVLYHWSFGYVDIGAPVLYNGSTSIYISLSLNQRSFVARYLPNIFEIGTQFSDYHVTIQKKQE